MSELAYSVWGWLSGFYKAISVSKARAQCPQGRQSDEKLENSLEPHELEPHKD